MKVKCVQLLSEGTREVLESSSWLSIGNIYHVLSIYMKFGGHLKFQLIGDDGITPAFHDAEQFEVVSGVIPSSWCVISKPGSHFELIPALWTTSGFLERYFDGEPEATLLFESEKEKMLKEEDLNAWPYGG
jgi:hypothetical protein